MAEGDPIDAPSPDTVVGRIETDRFCDECGFNMRTLPVLRDARTRLLLTRCTECGRLAYAGAATTAGRVWLQRLGILLLVVWMGAILLVTFQLALFETLIQMATLSELSEWSPVGRIANEDKEHYWAFMTLVLSVSAALGFVMVSIYACAAHHWRRGFHYALALVVPLVPMTIVWRLWNDEAPHLVSWGWLYILAHTGMHMGAGVLGAMFGRTAARGLATVLLPPRTRGMLGFLWLADGKPLPTIRAGGGRGASVSGIS